MAIFKARNALLVELRQKNEGTGGAMASNNLMNKLDKIREASESKE